MVVSPDYPPKDDVFQLAGITLHPVLKFTTDFGHTQLKSEIGMMQRTQEFKPEIDLTTSLRRVWRDPLFWVTCALVVIYLGWVSLRPAGVFWSLDEGGKYIYVQNTIKTGNPGAPLEYPGRYLDQRLHFVPLYFWSQEGNQIYSWWPVGFPLMSIPFYQLMGWIGLYVIPAVSGALCAMLSGLLVRHIHPQGRWLAAGAAIITGLATPVAFYSTTFWEHTPSTACFIGAVLSVLHAWKTNRARWIVMAGLLTSFATFLRTDIAGMIVGVGLILLFLRWRWAILLGISYVLTSFPWLLLNWHFMGHFLSRQWIKSPVTLNTPLFGGVREAGLWFIPYALFNAPRIGAFELKPTVLAFGMLLTLIALVAPFLKKYKWISLIAYAGLVGVCGGVLLQPEGYRSVHGFVLIAPQIVFASWLYVSRSIWRSSIFPAVLLGVSTMYGVAYLARGWIAAGGLQWGPRYMLPLYPLLVVASVKGLALARSLLGRSARGGLLILFLICVLIGLGYQVRGAYAALETMRYYQQTKRAIQRLGTEPIVTSCTWLPMVIPDLYWTGSVFIVHTTTQLEDWGSEARKVGIRSAYSVKVDLCNVIPLDEIAIQRSANPSGITVERLEVNAGP